MKNKVLKLNGKKRLRHKSAFMVQTIIVQGLNSYSSINNIGNCCIARTAIAHDFHFNKVPFE